MTVSVESAAKRLCMTSGWKISNLSLQKMLYLADMNFVGQNNARLVDEDFEAWDYGPVLPSLYHTCKIFGVKNLRDVFWGAPDISGTPEAAMIDCAWLNLRDRTAGELVENTHTDIGGWMKNYVVGARGVKIPASDMIEEYRKRIERSTETAA